MRGSFIVLEGIDGSGKTTQMDLVHKWLNAENVPHVVTREPGGVTSADAVRLLLAQSGNSWSPMGQALLLNAARVEHTLTLIEPNLSCGTHVLSDRYVDSTLAYQGGDDEAMVNKLLALHTLVVGPRLPDVSLWLDIDFEVGQERLRRRVKQGEVHDFEKKHALQEKARKGYAYLSKRFPERFIRVDAGGTKKETFECIQRHLRDRIT